MYAINCLLPISKLNKVAVDAADANGGIEMGTWGFMAWIRYINKALGLESEYRGTGTVKTYDGFNVQTRYSVEQCAKVAAQIKADLRHGKKKKNCGKTYIELLPGDPQRGGAWSALTVERKWVLQFKEVFSQGCDVLWVVE
jgi:hypothetical protein